MFGFLGTASHQGVKKGVGGGHSREKTCFFWGRFATTTTWDVLLVLSKRIKTPPI